MVAASTSDNHHTMMQSSDGLPPEPDRIKPEVSQNAYQCNPSYNALWPGCIVTKRPRKNPWKASSRRQLSPNPTRSKSDRPTLVVLHCVPHRWPRTLPSELQAHAPNLLESRSRQFLFLFQSWRFHINQPEIEFCRHPLEVKKDTAIVRKSNCTFRLRLWI
jgi:hypothetical protein